MEKLTLNYKGRDSWSRPVYEAGGNLYVDVDPRKDRKPHICTKYNNEFDGEPDMPVSEDIQFTFVPCRDTWNQGGVIMAITMIWDFDSEIGRAHV